MSYTVKTPVFSGPFDLLLQLVSKQVVDVAALSIAQITDQYVEEVRAFTEDAQNKLDLDVASDFLLVAATLLEIKSRALLGRAKEEKQDDEESSYLSAEDAKEILIQRLIVYKQFRDASAALAARFETESKMYSRSAPLEEDFLSLVPDYAEGIPLEVLPYLLTVLEVQKEQVLAEANHIAPKRIPVAEAVSLVDARLQTKRKTSFEQLLGEKRDVPDAVVLLLALLELYKFGSITLSQKRIFADIDITRKEGAPAYTGALTNYDTTSETIDTKE